MMRKKWQRHDQKTIQHIRREVISGKSKYRVAKEMNIEHHTIERHTKGLPSRHRSEPCIQGKSFDLLKQLLPTGVISSNKETHDVMRTMRRHLPMIRYSRFNHKAVYYLDDKNKRALQSLLENDTSKIINYQELNQMLRVFNINTDVDGKKSFLGRNHWRKARKIREFVSRYGSVSKEKQSRIDDFLGRFLHSEVLWLPQEQYGE